MADIPGLPPGTRTGGGRPMIVKEGGKMLGAFGELPYAGRIRMTAIPSADRVAFQYMKLAGDIDNVELPLIAAKRIARQDMQERFDQDKDPDGNPWTPLDPEYLKKKAKMKRLRTVPENILTLSYDLERAATSDKAWIVTSDSLWFSTKALPFYWDVHESGSNEGEMAGYRQSVVDRKKSGFSFEDDPKGGAHANMGVGRGQATPPRPFVGLSDTSINLIAEVFDLWFDDAVKDFFIHSKTGTLQKRIGGRFGGHYFGE